MIQYSMDEENKSNISFSRSTLRISLLSRLLICIFLMNMSLLCKAHSSVVPHAEHCSRERSRKARDVLDTYLYPFLKTMSGNMTAQCALHKHKDMFREHEEHKYELRRSQWKCNYCGKIFRTEAFLDTHFENRHSDHIPKGAEVCLADYCDLIHCDHDHPLRVKHEHNFFACKPTDVEGKRHLCEAIAQKCFPREEGPDLANMHDFFVRQFCEAHTCSPARQMFPDGKVGRGSRWFLMLLAFLFIGMMGFYLSVACSQQSKPRGYHDLRRTRPEATKNFKDYFAFFSKAKKKKMY